MRLLLATLSLLLTSTLSNAAGSCSDQNQISIEAILPLDRPSYSAFEALTPPEQESELHIVSSYEGSGTVVIGPTKKQVVLVLSSYKASRWQVSVLPGGRLAKVYLLGNETGQRIIGIADDIPIQLVPGHSPYGGEWEGQRGRTSYMREAFKHFLAFVRCQTGLAENSYQSRYDLGSSFAVPPSGDYVVKQAIATPSIPRVEPPLDTTAQLRSYDDAVPGMVPELRPAATILIDLMRKGRLPVFLPDGHQLEDAAAPADLRPLNFPPATATHRVATDDRNCDTSAIVGTDRPETFKCPWGDQWWALGGGDDVMSDSWDDDVFVAGPGNDIIDAGWGTDIVLLQPGWGDDVLSKTCHESTLKSDDRDRLGWTYPYVNFLVFGPGVDPRLLEWRDHNTIAYLPTGDVLTLVDDCFTMVFSEDGVLATRPAAVLGKAIGPARQ